MIFYAVASGIRANSQNEIYRKENRKMFASQFVTRLRNIVITTSYLDNCTALPEPKSSKQGLGLMRTFEIIDRLIPNRFSVNGLKHDDFGVLRVKRSLGRL